MNTSSHISPDTLNEIAVDRATPEALEAAMAHVATCSACHDELSRLRRRTSATNISPTGMQPTVRRIIATLIFDSRNSTRAFGVRSLHAGSRQLLYSADEADVDLRVTVQDEECIVVGQVIRDPCAGGMVEILGPTGSAQAQLNELCEFALSPVPAGTYSLKLTTANVEIEIPELEFRN